MSTHKGMKITVLLVTTALLLGIMADYSRADQPAKRPHYIAYDPNDTYCNVRSGPGLNYNVIATLPNFEKIQLTGKQHFNWKEIILPDGRVGWIHKNLVRKADEPKQSQQVKEVAPPLPNGISLGGISIGITELMREKNIALVRFVFRRIKDDEFPLRFTVLVTDDRGNEYEAEVYHYPFLAMPSVGSTWTTDSPIIIKIPKIAPISKLELIPETGSKFNLDYRKLTPLSPLSLKFKINPEQVLTGKEIKQDKNISIWLGEPKIEETIKEKSVEKTISVSVPVIRYCQVFSANSLKGIIVNGFHGY